MKKSGTDKIKNGFVNTVVKSNMKVNMKSEGKKNF